VTTDPLRIDAVETVRGLAKAAVATRRITRAMEGFADACPLVAATVLRELTRQHEEREALGLKPSEP
jgi:hypothetical protein